MRLLIFSLIIAAQGFAQEPASVGPVPTETQLQWQDMEMNAFVHFSMNTFTDKEWGYGDEDPKLFNPSSLDATQWVKTLKDAGFKGIILTAKHHDGFCLWPTAYTDHSVKSAPWKNGGGDVVGEMSGACKKQGVRFGVYLSPWDRHQSFYGQAAYISYYRNQLQELFTRYGNIFEMWFDGANGGDGYYGGARETRKIDGSTYYDWPNTLRMVRNIQPQVLFFSDAGPDIRWCGNEEGRASETNWNTITPDTLFAGKAGISDVLNTGSADGTRWIPQETDVSIRPGWFYHQSEDSLVKTPERLFEIYLQSVGRGAQLLLNVPPDRSGMINQHDIDALKGFRKLLDDAFRTNLAARSSIGATGTRSDEARFGPRNLIDGNAKTYWAAQDGITQSSIDISMPKVKTVTYVVLQEYLALGQRVKSFTVEVWRNGKWVEAAKGTTIGHKRILKIKRVQTSRVRIRIDDAKACPVLSEVGLF